MGDRRLIPLTEARQRLGISKATMSRLVKEGCFTIFTNPLDRRQKLVDEAEIHEYIRPKPLPRDDETAAHG